MTSKGFTLFNSFSSIQAFDEREVGESWIRKVFLVPVVLLSISVQWKVMQTYPDNIRSHISCYLRETAASTHRDNEMLTDIFAVAKNEYIAITSLNRDHAESYAEQSLFIGELRLIPSRVWSQLIRQRDDRLMIEVGRARLTKLNRLLLAFQPAIFKPIEDHFLKRGGARVDFFAKQAGQQIGTVAMVAFADGRKSQRYFVKSHRNSQVSGDSFAHITSDKAHNVDYKELFVYRVLGNLNLGPATEFIFSEHVLDCVTPETGLLIASLDLSHYDADEPPIKFSSFAALRSQLREQLIHQGLRADQLTAALDSAQAELFSSPVAQHDLKTIDLICRLMHLDDVLVNMGNFGQTIHVESQLELGWKVLDFSVGNSGLHTRTDSYIVPTIANQFREVDGRLNYDDVPILREALLSSDGLCDSIKSEILLGRDGVPGLEAILRTTADEIRHLMESHSTILRLKEDLHNRKMLDLAVYAEAVMVNLHAV